MTSKSEKCRISNAGATLYKIKLKKSKRQERKNRDRLSNRFLLKEREQDHSDGHPLIGVKTLKIQPLSGGQVKAEDSPLKRTLVL